MNNLSSYCGLVDAKIRVSDKDLPVSPTFDSFDMESKSLKFDSNNIFSSFIKSLNLTSLSEVFLFCFENMYVKIPAFADFYRLSI